MESINQSMIGTNIKFNENIPQSHEKFLQRLKTFKVFKWFAKPEAFSPLECARHGWANIAKDTLKCYTCSNIIYLNSKMFTNKDSDDQSILKDKHNQNCPWKNITVSDSFIGVNVFDEEKAHIELNKRKLSLIECQKLPVMSQEVLEKFHDPLIDGSEELKAFEQSHNTTEHIELIACSGWKYNQKLLECSKCLRSAGLWLFKTEEQFISPLKNYANTGMSAEIQVLDNIITMIENEEMISKAQKRKINEDPISQRPSASLKYFDPINEHYSWCPWRRDDTYRSFRRLITRYKLKQIKQEVSKTKYRETSDMDSTVSSKLLRDRVQNAQNLLIESTSHFSLKQ